MVLDGDWAIDRATTVVQPRIGIVQPTGDERCPSSDVDSSLTQGFVGPTIFAGHCGCCSHDGKAIFVGHWGCGALVEEGPPFVFLSSVLPVWRCSLAYAAPASSVFVLTLNGGVRVIGVANLRIVHWPMACPMTFWHLPFLA
jgi:hypothetical protein